MSLSKRSLRLIMPKKDPRVDAYITKSSPFAQLILKHIREQVHAACPAAEETIKSGVPHFMHKGILCSMAAFKNHCALGLWRGSQVLGGKQDRLAQTAMGSFGRLTRVSDLPSRKVFGGYIKKAAQLNEAGMKRVKAPPSQGKSRHRKSAR